MCDDFEFNGRAYGNITPYRGIRQGDPLSPYLFLLCAEGFSSLLAKIEGEGRIHGVSICRRAPSISHLLFTDDSLLFAKPIRKRCKLFLRFYRHMLVSSGQCINFEKSFVYFSNNTEG